MVMNEHGGKIRKTLKRVFLRDTLPVYYRNGVQTVTVNEALAFYKQVTTHLLE